MPIYEYRCERCGKIFEEFEYAASDGKGRECPSCGSKETKRVISSFSPSGKSGDSSASSCGPTRKGGFT
jgi:putative FmdB family regulatory protein